MCFPDLVLITGAPRSGTTLMTLVANSHPQVAITNEINLIRASYAIEKAMFRRRYGGTRKKTRRENWKPEQIIAQIPKREPTLARLLQLYCRSIKREDSNVVVHGDKLPWYHKFNVEKFARHFGLRVHVIFMVRNPIDVVSSVLRRTRNAKAGLDSWQGPWNVELAANEWIEAWNSFSRPDPSAEVTVMKVNYDRFIADPVAGADALSGFLGVDNQFNLTFVSDAELDPELNIDQLRKVSNDLASIAEAWAELPLLLTDTTIQLTSVQIPLYKTLALKVKKLMRLNYGITPKRL